MSGLQLSRSEWDSAGNCSYGMGTAIFRGPAYITDNHSCHYKLYGINQ
jgi:hypothetical protein